MLHAAWKQMLLQCRNVAPAQVVSCNERERCCVQLREWAASAHFGGELAPECSCSWQKSVRCQDDYGFARMYAALAQELDRAATLQCCAEFDAGVLLEVLSCKC
jgi:hypothetical protein